MSSVSPSRPDRTPFLPEMQRAGASQVPQGIQLGTMTAHNECMIGDEIELKPHQLYFFETFRGQNFSIRFLLKTTILTSYKNIIEETEICILNPVSYEDYLNDETVKKIKKI